MRAAVYVIPCAGVLQAAGEHGLHRGSGIVHAALRTAERLEEAADLVLVAVPAGSGQGLADKLVASGRVIPKRQPARYLSEEGAEFDELGELVAKPPEANA